MCRQLWLFLPVMIRLIFGGSGGGAAAGGQGLLAYAGRRRADESDALRLTSVYAIPQYLS
jgi:hypothetical protein